MRTFLLLYLIVLICCFASDSTAANEDIYHDLISEDAAVRRKAAEEILQNPQKEAIPLVAEACFHFTLRRDSKGVEEISAILRKLTGNQDGRKYFDWVRWIGSHPEIKPLSGYPDLKAKVLSQIDPSFAAFFEQPDTFKIRMEEIVWGGVKKDGIPALVNPPSVPAEAAAYWKDEDKVLGISINGHFRAYPLRIMDWHEMANDTIDSVRVVIPYCTLCGSAILYKATANGQTFTFGSSGLLYRSNKLMYDRETNSLWSALSGEPVSGPLADRRLKLEMLPIVVTTWGIWRRKHPETTVLNIQTGHNRDYNKEPYKEYFNSDKNMFPVPFENRELSLKDFVFALRIGETKKAYPMNLLAKKKMLEDKVGNMHVVLVADEAGRSARAYQCEGEKPEKSWKAEEDSLISPDGKSACKRISGHVAYWFGWYAQFPDTLLYKD